MSEDIERVLKNIKMIIKRTNVEQTEIILENYIKIRNVFSLSGMHVWNTF